MPPFFKFVAVAIVWVMVSAITIIQLVVPGVEFNWIFSIALFGIAAGVTNSILRDGDDTKARPMVEVNTSKDAREQMTGKAKRDQQGISADMLSLLDEEDIAELRRRLKNRLMDRIDGGDDGELSTLDALLADQDPEPRRRKRS